MSAMNLVMITDQAGLDLAALHNQLKKQVHEFIYDELSRRNRPMDEYEDTYRVKADFFCCVIHSTAIYFEREKNNTVIIARIINKR